MPLYLDGEKQEEKMEGNKRKKIDRNKRKKMDRNRRKKWTEIKGKNGHKPEKMYEKYIRFKWKIQVGVAKQYWKFKWQRNKILLMVLTRLFSSSSKPHCIMALHYPIVFR